MDSIIEKIKSFGKKYWLILLSGVLSSIICFSVIAAFLCRNYAVGMIKNRFEDMAVVLNSLGYDYAYDEISFYSFSPWQIMRIKNLRFYTKEGNVFQWTIDEVNIDVGLWDYEKITIFVGDKQSVQKGNNVWDVELLSSELYVNLKNNSLDNVEFKGNDIVIKNLLNISEITFNLNRNNEGLLSADLDAKGIIINDMTGWALNKTIDHVFISSSLSEYWNSERDFNDAFYDWIDRGGRIIVNKIILNWKPLIMVANGDVKFNNKLEPKVSLNTASLALVETLEKLNSQGFLLNKGTFVVKILLNNKVKKQNFSDKHKMVVSPLKITKDKVLLENIRIR